MNEIKVKCTCGHDTALVRAKLQVMDEKKKNSIVVQMKCQKCSKKSFQLYSDSKFGKYFPSVE